MDEFINSPGTIVKDFWSPISATCKVPKFHYEVDVVGDSTDKFPQEGSGWMPTEVIGYVGWPNLRYDGFRIGYTGWNSADTAFEQFWEVYYTCDIYLKGANDPRDNVGFVPM